MSVRKTIVLSTIQQNLICTPDNKGMADLITIAAFKPAAVNLEIDDIPAKRPLINANHFIYDGDLATITGVTKRYSNLLPVREVTQVAEIGSFRKQKDTTLNGWDDSDPLYLDYIKEWEIFERHIKASKSSTQVKAPETLFNLLDKSRTDMALYGKRWAVE